MEPLHDKRFTLLQASRARRRFGREIAVAVFLYPQMPVQKVGLPQSGFQRTLAISGAGAEERVGFVLVFLSGSFGALCWRWR